MEISRTAPLESVLETTIRDCRDNKVTVGSLLDGFGDRSFGPIIMLLGLLVVIPPVGAIPGLPMVVGAVILLFSLQIVFGAHHIWMPEIIQKQGISCDKLEKAEDRVKPWLARIDGMISKRLTWATGKVATRLAALAVSALALLLIPLELVPFAVGLPGLAIVLFGLALVARDGVLMLASFAATLGAWLLAALAVPWGQVAGVF